ncbi:hypothetical protein [Humibacter sp. RRB41]|uniref:hypothetical protein n=1 Tax=Humibacter sp. RRB41 TaxID=2919946 RepID=UPI001FA9A8D8|nr:hypothetical protein [Humibacter sp. RRB41]
MIKGALKFRPIPTLGGPTTDGTGPAVVDRIVSTAAGDPAAAIGALIVLVALIAAGATVLALWLHRRNRTNARIAAMSPAEREQHDARLAYQTSIRSAEKALDAATKARSARLKASEKALTQAQTFGNHRIAHYRGKDGSASVSPTAITVPQGTFALTASVMATVDTAGNLATSSRSTLTRIAAGGLLFGPVGAIVGGVAKKTRMHDARELYLLIQSDAFAAVITCNPDDGQRLRQFATAVRQAALNADAARQHWSQLVAQSEHALALEQQNTGEVDAARSALHRVTADTSRVDAANAALALEQAPPPPLVE